jgi:hypothetical protein
MLSFLNFKDIGATVENKSAAFKKIRANSKTFNTSLVHTPTAFMNRYTMINKLLVNETKFLESNNYGLKRQHNLTANAAVSCNNLNFLDQSSFNQFLDHSCKYSLTRPQTSFFDTNPHVVDKKATNEVSVSSVRDANILNSYLLGQSKSFAVAETLDLSHLITNDQSNRSLLKDVFQNSTSTQTMELFGPFFLVLSNLSHRGDTSLGNSTSVVESLVKGTQINELSPKTSVRGDSTQSFLNFDNIFNVSQQVANYELKNASADMMIIPAEQSIRYQLGNLPRLPKRSNLNHSSS